MVENALLNSYTESKAFREELLTVSPTAQADKLWSTDQVSLRLDSYKDPKPEKPRSTSSYHIT